MTNRTTNIELLEWQTKIVLKALLGQEQHLTGEYWGSAILS